MYKVDVDVFTKQPNCIIRFEDNACIPLDPANTDCQKFKLDILVGAELQDANGNVMTVESAKAFAAAV